MSMPLQQFGKRSDCGSQRPPEQLPIAETFASIQGEGKMTGIPSFFIRVSGCNLRCVWCDTPYASWDPEYETKSVGSLVQEVVDSRLRQVVITGGEPMIFPAVEILARELNRLSIHITIETAGTVFRPVVCDLISISPKLSNSTPINDGRDKEGTWAIRHQSRRLNLKALQSLLDRSPERQLKFVVSSPDDLEEIEQLMRHILRWCPSEVLLMPEGTSPPDRDREKWVVDECMKRGWRYCPRIHISLFGNVRGT
jgi:7-carboxy-7-deazaguanine synthase